MLIQSFCKELYVVDGNTFHAKNAVEVSQSSNHVQLNFLGWGACKKNRKCDGDVHS